MKTYNRKILVFLSDLHSGHKLGLLNPETQLQNQDFGTVNDQIGVRFFNPKLLEVQNYLWDLYEEKRNDVVKLAGKDEIILFCMGDLSQGNKYPSEQFTTRIVDQIDITYYNLLPWMKMKGIETIRVVKGTGAHTFAEGSAEIIVTNRLQYQFHTKDIRVLYPVLQTLINS